MVVGADVVVGGRVVVVVTTREKGAGGFGPALGNEPFLSNKKLTKRKVAIAAVIITTGALCRP